jgi:hypothetical protein
MEGSISNSDPNDLTHVVRLEDDDAEVELIAVCSPPPEYLMRAVRGRILAGGLDPALEAKISQLAGTRMVAGFTKRVADIAGPGAKAGLFLNAAIEVARLARQVNKLEPEAVQGPLDALRCWQLDTKGVPDVAGSCFVYSDQGRMLLESRRVVPQAVPALYCPPPGQERVFVRKRRMRLVRTGSRLDLFHSMHDNVHGFDIHYEVEIDTRIIVAADSVTSRLPYRNVCDEPQARMKSMVGQHLDAHLKRTIQSPLGGESGCSQLFDLTSDLLKLLSPVH